MTSQDLHHILKNAAAVNKAQTLQLEKVLEKYPYFQAARAVHLKGLFTEDSLSYNYELKKTAAYTADRSVLFDFITSEEFQQDKIALEIKKQEQHLRNITVFEPQEVFGRRSIPMDDAISMKKTESERVMDPGLFTRPEKPVAPPQSLAPEEKTKEQPSVSKGQPLNFDRNEAHSSSEWLRLTSVKPVERKNEEDTSSRDRKFELIDDFISKSPRIDTSLPAGNSNFAKDRTVPPEALMTETLARVYLEQKNFKKAIRE